MSAVLSTEFDHFADHVRCEGEGCENTICLDECPSTVPPGCMHGQNLCVECLAECIACRQELREQGADQ